MLFGTRKKLEMPSPGNHPYRGGQTPFPRRRAFREPATTQGPVYGGAARSPILLSAATGGRKRHSGAYVGFGLRPSGNIGGFTPNPTYEECAPGSPAMRRG